MSSVSSLSPLPRSLVSQRPSSRPISSARTTRLWRASIRPRGAAARSSFLRRARCCLVPGRAARRGAQAPRAARSRHLSRRACACARASHALRQTSPPTSSSASTATRLWRRTARRHARAPGATILLAPRQTNVACWRVADRALTRRARRACGVTRSVPHLATRANGSCALRPCSRARRGAGSRSADVCPSSPFATPRPSF